ncbi:MAG: hypothetical protein GX558_07345 [Clostridiales bacterium]|nr:hypothetical protein [Clostridiales bacterium]
MTERARAAALLRGETPDRVPWFGDLSYWYPYAMDKGVIGPQYAGDGLFRLHRDLGVGFYLQGYFPFREECPGAECRVRRSGAEILTEWTTPVGTLRQAEVALPASYTVAIREHMIKSAEDLKIYAWMMERTRYRPDYEEARRRYPLAGENGAVLCYLPKSPYMDMVALKAGIVAVVDLIADEGELFDDVMALLEEKHDQAAEIALNSPAEWLMIPENISSEVVGKRPYAKYMRGYHQKWTGRIRGAGKVSFVHLDGTMRGLIGELSQSGFQVIEALTPAPVGDIPIEELHQWVEPATVLWGGLPGVYFTDLLSDAQFDEFVLRTLDQMARAPRYVLGVADQVPPGSRPERIARVRELVNRNGKYR